MASLSEPSWEKLKEKNKLDANDFEKLKQLGYILNEVLVVRHGEYSERTGCLTPNGIAWAEAFGTAIAKGKVFKYSHHQTNLVSSPEFRAVQTAACMGKEMHVGQMRTLTFGPYDPDIREEKGFQFDEVCDLLLHVGWPYKREAWSQSLFVGHYDINFIIVEMLCSKIGFEVNKQDWSRLHGFGFAVLIDVEAKTCKVINPLEE